MAYSKTIVCLANSWKTEGRCVAGREFRNGSFGEWIRPVSDRSTEEISDSERRFSDNRYPRLLDVIEIHMLEPRPHGHQQENHLIDAEWFWKLEGTLGRADLEKAVEDPQGPLWLNGDSSRHGLNDRVPERLALNLGRSLYLVRPDEVQIRVAIEENFDGESKMRIRANFTLNGYEYTLSVTDPMIQRRYADVGTYEQTGALVCVSLGEIYNGFAYKLAASILTLEEKR